MLIGKNVLERGGFLIDPKLDEEDIDNIEIDWDMLAERFKDEEVEPLSLEITEEDVIKYIKDNT